jgi:hypothetical protein
VIHRARVPIDAENYSGLIVYRTVSSDDRFRNSRSRIVVKMTGVTVNTMKQRTHHPSEDSPRKGFHYFGASSHGLRNRQEPCNDRGGRSSLWDATVEVHSS